MSFLSNLFGAKKKRRRAPSASIRVVESPLFALVRRDQQLGNIFSGLFGR